MPVNLLLVHEGKVTFDARPGHDPNFSFNLSLTDLLTDYGLEIPFVADPFLFSSFLDTGKIFENPPKRGEKFRICKGFIITPDMELWKLDATHVGCLNYPMPLHQTSRYGYSSSWAGERFLTTGLYMDLPHEKIVEVTDKCASDLWSRHTTVTLAEIQKLFEDNKRNWKPIVRIHPSYDCYKTEKV